MSNYIFDENNGLWYEQQGDYYIPCLDLPSAHSEQPVGILGQRHLRHIKQHRRLFYINLLTSGKLNSYLIDIDRQAQERFELLVRHLAECEGITEQLKANNQME